MKNNINGFNLPKDLTPAQRAGLKLASHFAMIFVFNAILAATAYIDSLHGTPLNWNFLGIVIVSQAVLAVGDATKKYFSAHGDIPLSVLIGLAQNEVATHAPEVKYSPNEQAIKQAVENVIFPQPQDAAAVIATPANWSNTVTSSAPATQTIAPLPGNVINVIPAPANDPTPPSAA